MGKIFGIGLSKTGTTSLTEALRILGYRAIHYDLGLSRVDDCDAMTDLPVANAFALLDEMYPNSKFIYTTRDTNSWLESCRFHWCEGIRRDESLANPEVVALHKKMFGTYDYNPELFVKAYADHDKRVREHFKGRQDDLLILNICASPEWVELCRFLGKPIPDAPFPHANTRQQNMVRIRWRKFWRVIKPAIPKPIRASLKPFFVKKVSS